MKILDDISIVICGAAGQGVQTVEQFLVYLFKNSGFHVFATKEYMSRVRGGLNSIEIRVGSKNKPVNAFVSRVDLFVPLHKNATKHILHRLTENTFILGDPDTIDEKNSINQENIVTFDFLDHAKKVGGKIYANIIAVGTIAGLFSSERDTAVKFLHEKFSKKGKEIVENDLRAFDIGYKFGEDLKNQKRFDFNLVSDKGIKSNILFPGSEAIGMGAIAGGCNFISAYPMSPHTAVLVFLAQKSNEFDIVVDQAEDEIAAINKTIGAWYAGARALASTSGGGFALMTEGISLAGIIESPVVIHIAQRPGPGTGLPTRTAQEDLNLALYAGHGEFPRIIYAPGTLEQGFYLTQKAFNIADKYQIPVFILTDQYYMDTYYDFPELDISNLKVENAFIETEEDYLRYKLTEDGLSPRGIPGYGEGLVRVDSDEHDEFGHITEDMRKMRKNMTEKRLFKKSKLIEKEIVEPDLVGSQNYKNLIICWGSNYNVVKEAISFLPEFDIAMLHFQQLYPINPDVLKYFSSAERVFIAENNATGQFSNILQLKTGFKIPDKNKKLKFTGEPFSVEEIVGFLKNRIAGGVH